jgi:4-amino-4-deoxy-L-arabinose transferase-like glycosyltransferase
VTTPRELSARAFAGWMVIIALVAIALRLSFPTADPPWTTTVGIVWHDEGAWVHNARNRALFGAWSTDAWNPMYIAPVFTGLEYASFALFGVGLWQARLVSELAGIASVVLLALGIRRIAGREAGLIAGALLATNYVYVMWNRAALMEASMVGFMVAGWYCYVRAQTQPLWGVMAAACALLAYFTKAAAIFFVVALGVEALAVVIRTRTTDAGGLAARRAAVATLAGLTVCGVIALAIFVIPNWTDYRFYNWQMSVTRKPSYDLQSLLNRVTWFPIVHDIFTRMWFTVVLAVLACLSVLGRWRTLPSGERLLVLWVGLGALELLLHDVGNERRFVFFIPAFAGLAAIVLGERRRLVPAELAAMPRLTALAAAPIVFYGLYVVAGALTRLVALYEPRPGVRLGAAVALIATVAVYASWPKLPRLLSAPQWSARAAFLVVALSAGGQLAQFAQWAGARTYKNYLASRQLGDVLPAGTLVHGKLANGLALENGIRPIFVGRGFGNYDDRKQRDDVRYILTYVAPYVGYEGPVIQDVLAAYPNRTIISTFDVAETATGHDRAALIDKFGDSPGKPGEPEAERATRRTAPGETPGNPRTLATVGTFGTRGSTSRAQN